MTRPEASFGPFYLNNVATHFMQKILIAGRFRLELGRPLIMGVVNVTPDSFSDGGRYFTSDEAIRQAWRLVEDGAELLDIGGESSRPGAESVSVQDEIDRILPVVRALRDADVPVSIDTVKPDVMKAALDAGASMVNDINALRVPAALKAVAASDAAICLMHMQGNPRTMQQEPSYENVIVEVKTYLVDRARAVMVAGVDCDRIVLDPGFGFGKSLEHNLDLLGRLDEIAALGFPTMAGLSRKSMLGAITGRSVDDRLHASVAAALLAAERGASILRVHDVAATRDALAVRDALLHRRVIQDEKST